MNASVTAVVDSRSFADPDAVAKEVAPRKVRRLLDTLTLAPFVVAVKAIESLGPVDPEEVAFYSLSSWDPSVPVPDEPVSDQDELIEFYLNPMHASDWLRRMPHGLACQVAVATGLRGPNLHLVGGPESLPILLRLAAHALTGPRVQAAVVVAFDDPTKSRHVLPDDGCGQAVGLAVRHGEGVCAVGDLLDALAQATAAGTVAGTALETLRALAPLRAHTGATPAGAAGGRP